MTTKDAKLAVPARWVRADRAIRDRGWHIHAFWNPSGKPGCFTVRAEDDMDRMMPPGEEGDIWWGSGPTLVDALDDFARRSPS